MNQKKMYSLSSLLIYIKYKIYEIQIKEEKIKLIENTKETILYFSYFYLIFTK